MLFIVNPQNTELIRTSCLIPADAFQYGGWNGLPITWLPGIRHDNNTLICAELAV
jgi:hypothetical protein